MSPQRENQIEQAALARDSECIRADRVCQLSGGGFRLCPTRSPRTVCVHPGTPLSEHLGGHQSAASCFAGLAWPAENSPWRLSLHQLARRRAGGPGPRRGNRSAPHGRIRVDPAYSGPRLPPRCRLALACAVRSRVEGDAVIASLPGLPRVPLRGRPRLRRPSNGWRPRLPRVAPLVAGLMSLSLLLRDRAAARRPADRAGGGDAAVKSA